LKIKKKTNEHETEAKAKIEAPAETSEPPAAT